MCVRSKEKSQAHMRMSLSKLEGELMCKLASELVSEHAGELVSKSASEFE